MSRAPRTKTTLSDFHEWCRVNYPIFMNISWVDGLSTGPPGMGRHIWVMVCVHTNLCIYNIVFGSGFLCKRGLSLFLNFCPNQLHSDLKKI